MRHLDFTGPKNEKISSVFGYDYRSSLRILSVSYFEIFLPEGGL
jgi:hypothetical protein